MHKNLFKKFGATFVALTLAFSSASAVSAAGDTSEFQPKVTYSNGNYTFAKLSHSDKAVSTPDGIVDYLGGGNVGVTGQDQGATGKVTRGRVMLGLQHLMVIGCMLVLVMQQWVIH